MENKQNFWGDKRFYSLDFALKEKFGRKVAKLSLDAGFTCPTRDGTKGFRGCLFCSRSGSGDFTHKGSIKSQMEKQAETAMRKWKNCAYIAYFQSYTNTYAATDRLRCLFDEALSFPDTVGLAVATRCDCIPDEVLELLAEYNQKTYLWVELGMQTASDETGNIIRRGFETRELDDAVRRLANRNIRSVVHLIAGLPGEDREAFLKSVRHAGSLPIWGIKLQMLYVLYDSDLYNYYLGKTYNLFSREEYAELICDALEILRPDIVVHRLTGDGKRENVYAPLWTKDKRRVITEINQELQRRDSFQGKFYLNI